MAKRRKSKYSAAEKKAYYSGMGYRVAYNGKAIPFKNEDLRVSFKAGFVAAGKAAKKYPKLKKEVIRNNPGYDYSKFFDFDERGLIKGNYSPDGFFEPD